MTHYLDRIWLYSAFYGEQLRISVQLHEEGNSYAAFLLLFNVLELLCKSLKESDDGIVYSFADFETWDIAYANYAPHIIEIMYNAIVNKDWTANSAYPQNMGMGTTYIYLAIPSVHSFSENFRQVLSLNIFDNNRKYGTNIIR